MLSPSMIGRGASRLATAGLLASVLTACAVTPEPISQQDFADRAAQDVKTLFQNQEPLNGPLTLEQALNRVLTYNLDVRSKMMEEALALGQLDLDRFDMLPQVVAQAGYDYRSEPNATTSRDVATGTLSDASPTYSTDQERHTGSLGLTWNILDFGVSYYAAHQNADRALIAKERRRRAVQELAQEVRFSFWRAAAAQALRDQVAVTVALAERALADAERVEVERLSDPVQSLRTQKTLLENLRQLEDIDREMSAAKAELAALINLPPGSDFRIAADEVMPIPTLDFSLDTMEELALTNNPDLRVQAYATRITADETRKAILRLLPGISLNVSQEYDSNSFLDANRWMETGVQLSWNLLNVISGPGRVAHAESAEKLAETKRMALSMAVLAQVHVATTRYAQAVRAFQRADKLMLVETRLATMMSTQASSGTRSVLERITTQTSAITAQLRRYSTYADLQAAYGRVDATLGRDPKIVADVSTPAPATEGPTS